MEKLIHKNHLKRFSATLIVLCLLLVTISIVSAAHFDNKKSFDDKIGDYGKVTIKDWFGLLNLIELELKTNTEECGKKCSAEKEATLYQKGSLIDEIRFIDLNTGIKVNIKNYQIYVDGKKYKLGTEIEQGTYDIILKGELKPFQKVDWQIKSNGFWIDEWARWQDSLNTDLIAYYDFDASSGSTLEDVVTGEFNGTLRNMSITDVWVGGKLGNSLFFNGTEAHIDSIGRIIALEDITLANYTISFWMNSSVVVSQQGILFGYDDNEDISNSDIYLYENGNNEHAFYSGGGETTLITTANSGLRDGEWHLITIVQNATHNVLYINQTLSSTVPSTGKSACADCLLKLGGGSNPDYYHRGNLDEFGIWNRSLSSSEIDTLYNSGTGVTYTTTFIFLNSPLDNLLSIDTIQNFSASAIPPSNNELRNATIFVWDEEGVVVNKTTNLITGSLLNTTNFSISNLPAGVLTWNVIVCYNDSIPTTTCKFAEDNYTLTYGMIENSQTYTSSTVEGVTNDFIINITHTSSEWDIISGILTYNKTEYPGTKIGDGDIVLFTSSASAPNVATATNITFYWTIGLTDVTGTTYINSTSYNQTVNIINMSLCGQPHNIPFVNFTFYDEQTFNPINGTIDLTFNYRQAGSTISNSFSYSNSSEATGTFDFCISPSDGTYILDSVLAYESTGYAQRYYNFEGVSFTNTTTEIGLYLLSTTNSTSFLVVVQDENYQPLADVEVYMQIYHAGSWETVEIATTNDDGETVNHIYTEDSVYRFKIYSAGTLLHTTTGSIISCPSTPCTVTITISAEIDEVLPDFEDLVSLTSSLVYSKSTEIVTYTYTDTSGNFTRGRLYVIRKAFGESDITFTCNDTSSIATAILTCDLSTSNNGTYIATGFITRTNERMVERKAFHKIRDIVGVIGLDGVLWSMFLLIGILMLGVYRPSLGIIFGVVGVVMLSLLQLIQITITAIVALIGIAAILLIEVGKQ